MKLKGTLWALLMLVLFALIPITLGSTSTMVMPVDKPFFEDYEARLFKLAANYEGYTVYVYYYHPAQDKEHYRYFGFALHLSAVIRSECSVMASGEEGSSRTLRAVYDNLLANLTFLDETRIGPIMCPSKKLIAVGAPKENIGKAIEEVNKLISPYREDMEKYGIRVEVYPLKYGPLLLSLDPEINRYIGLLDKELRKYGLNLVPYTGISSDPLNTPYIQVNTSTYLEMIKEDPAEARAKAEQIAKNIAEALRNIGFPIHEVIVEISYYHELGIMYIGSTMPLTSTYRTPTTTTSTRRVSSKTLQTTQPAQPTISSGGEDTVTSTENTARKTSSTLINTSIRVSPLSRTAGERSSPRFPLILVLILVVALLAATLAVRLSS